MNKYNKNINRDAVIELLKSPGLTANELMLKKRKISKKYKIPILENSVIIKEYKRLVADGKMITKPDLERLLRKRAVRTMSGIAPVAVLTKAYPCSGECAYCPTEPDVPQSYLSNEPAVMRAIRCGYDPYVQVQDRLRALVANGHEPEKIELIVIGGTWGCLPKRYQFWFIEQCFAAANVFTSPQASLRSLIPLLNKRGVGVRPAGMVSQSISLDELRVELHKEQKKNEKARYKIIGITLETRPDYIDERELLEMREFGCTRVELGVQAVDDTILKKNKRGHGVAEIARATKLLKDYGFKVTYHIMPGLPGATAAKDLKMFKSLFKDERFQPDQIKFYPTVVTKGSLLYKWWQAGKYKPYSDKVLRDLIRRCKEIVPRYVRIIRLIRDIPGESIVAGNRVTNLRQVLKDEGVKCECIRCREARGQRFKIADLRLQIDTYTASGGIEYFISYESRDGKVLFGFCRLRLPGINKEQSLKEFNSGYPELNSFALIRELHVYGELVPTVDPSTSSGRKRKRVQHSGLGKKLLKEVERIAEKEGYKKMAIISGVGVRDYYRRVGYRLKDTYMVKDLTRHKKL